VVSLLTFGRPSRSGAGRGAMLSPLSVQPTPRRSPRTRRQSRGSGAGAQLNDRVAVTSDLVRLIWEHRLWWVVPLLLALLLLAVLVVLESTPVGPLLYPLF